MITNIGFILNIVKRSIRELEVDGLIRYAHVNCMFPKIEEDGIKVTFDLKIRCNDDSSRYIYLVIKFSDNRILISGIHSFNNRLVKTNEFNYVYANDTDIMEAVSMIAGRIIQQGDIDHKFMSSKIYIPADMQKIRFYANFYPVGLASFGHKYDSIVLLEREVDESDIIAPWVLDGENFLYYVYKNDDCIDKYKATVRSTPIVAHSIAIIENNDFIQEFSYENTLSKVAELC